MLKKFLDKIQNGDRKKLIENTVIAAIIGIVILIAGSSLFGGEKKNESGAGSAKNAAAAAAVVTASGNTETEEERLEARLKELLSQIEGVGKLDLMVTFATASEKIPAYDTKKNESKTSEKDSSGGTREITQIDSDISMVFENNGNGSQSPVILTSVLPEIKGVVVVADGAARPEVRDRISKALQVLMDIPVHKIQVIERK